MNSEKTTQDMEKQHRRSISPRRFGLSVFGAILVIAGVFWIESMNRDWEQFNSDLNTYQGVTIGQTKLEVQYAVGTPQTIQGPEKDTGDGWASSSQLQVNPVEENDAIPTGFDPLPEGKSAEDFDAWHYWNKAGNFDVDFDAETGLASGITCWSGETRHCEPIFGIRSDTTEEAVRDLLGKPDKEELWGGGVFNGFPIEVGKQLDYDLIGLSLYLAEGKVSRITKKAPQNVGFWWWLSRSVA